MLTEKEKHGISELLERMTKSDLQSLAHTVTSRLLVPENSMEAIQTILQHSDNAQNLLRKKKMKKEVLFKYLHQKGVPIESTSDMNLMRSKILELWKSSDSECFTAIGNTKVGGNSANLDKNMNSASGAAKVSTPAPLQQLSILFPDFDRSLLGDMLASNEGNLEITIDQLLSFNVGKDQRDKATKLIGELNSSKPTYLSKDLRQPQETSEPKSSPVISDKTEAPPAWGTVEYGSAVDFIPNSVEN